MNIARDILAEPFKPGELAFPDRITIHPAVWYALSNEPEFYRIDRMCNANNPTFYGVPFNITPEAPEARVIFERICNCRKTGRCTECDGSGFVEYHRIAVSL